MRASSPVALLVVLFACKSADKVVPLSSAEVQEFVRQYVGAENAGDATKLMEMVSRDSGVGSIHDGDIDRGWQAIRVATDSYISLSARMRITVGTVDVMLLGPDDAIAMAPYHLTPLTSGTGIREWAGAMTIVVTRTPQGLRLVHEHYSLLRR